MDGSHPKNIDPRPKRRRDEENPYEIYTTGINTTHPRYFLAFTDSNKVKRWMEIDKTLSLRQDMSDRTTGCHTIISSTVCRPAWSENQRL